MIGSKGSRAREMPLDLTRAGRSDPVDLETPLSGTPGDHHRLGLPAAPNGQWPAIFPTRFLQQLEGNRPFRMLLDACTRCGLCADVCPVYQATGRPEDMPAAGVELANRVYHQCFGWYQRLSGHLNPSSQRLPLKTLGDWYRRFHRCLTCRRCLMACPYGLDPSEATMAARHMLAAIGMTDQTLSAQAASAVNEEYPEHSPHIWLKACRSLEKIVFDQTGMAVRFPVDQPGADVLLIPSVDDPFFHIGTMIGYGIVFHIAGISWTTHSCGPGAENFGLFLGEKPMKLVFQRIIESAGRLHPKMLVWGESGHGWQAALSSGHRLKGIGSLKWTQPVHILDHALYLLEKGAFDRKLDKGANQGLKVTYHDPCFLARRAGMTSAPRRLLEASVASVVEMDAATTHEHTLCCGGGAGMLKGRNRYFRLEAGRARADAFRKTGASALATACSECKFSLTESLARHLGHGPRVFGVMELFGRALVPYLTHIGKPAAK